VCKRTSKKGKIKMLKKSILSIFLLCATLFANEITWAKEFDSGIKESKAQNKPVLFVYSRHTCKYCVILEETTFQDKQVIETLNKDFISIISYTDENDYTPRALLSSGTPTIWFLKPDGEPMFAPLVSAVSAKNFLAALEIVKEELHNIQKGEKQ